MLQIEDQIIRQFQRSNHILILPSAPADGDSLGSALALYQTFIKLGKKVTVISAEPVPRDLKFLPMIEKVGEEFKANNDFVITVHAHVKDIKHHMEPGKVNIVLTPEEGASINVQDIKLHDQLDEFDLIVTVDTAELHQLGKFYEHHPEMFYKVPVINIDHHASNAEYGTINYVDITASAATEIIAPLIKKMEEVTGQKLMDADIATLLLAGIITDTGSFQHSNTTPKAFVVAAELLDQGARQQEIIKHVYKTKSLTTLKLWGQVLSKIQFDKDHKFVWSTISQEDLNDTGAMMEESGAIIDELLNNAPGAEIVALLKEKEPGLLSGSLRSITPEVDASAMAGLFGGGGHKQASGFKIKDVVFEEGVKSVIDVIRREQEKRHGVTKPKEDFDIEIHDLGQTEE
jgi:bifunctional oligoribonuclease and PAP phosphatase NrnA